MVEMDGAGRGDATPLTLFHAFPIFLSGDSRGERKREREKERKKEREKPETLFIQAAFFSDLKGIRTTGPAYLELISWRQAILIEGH